MSRLSNAVATAVIILATGTNANPLLAQDNGQQSFDKYTCKDIMRQQGSDRDAAIAFIHGYLLGKAGSSTFNVEALEKQTDAFVDHCLDNPNEKALDAMMKVKG